MRTVLVTGPIGSGKSEVCRYLASEGYPVYDCDSRTKALYESVPGLKERIEKALGIKWSEIGVIFTDASRRETLEKMVYPLLIEDINAWKASLEGDLAFIESAIALQKPQLDGLYDLVLMVTAPLSVREGRNPKVRDRDSLQEFDGRRIDFRIDNGSSIEVLHLKIDDLLCRLI